MGGTPGLKLILILLTACLIDWFNRVDFSYYFGRRTPFPAKVKRVTTQTVTADSTTTKIETPEGTRIITVYN